MRFTFQQMIQRLNNAKAFPVDFDYEQKKARLNEAFEAIFLSGDFNGTQGVITTTVTQTGILTLDRQFLTCKAVKVNGNVRDMASPWYSFLPGTSDLSQWSMNIQDLGDGFVVFKQPKQAAQLRIACSSETTTVEIHGKDATGAEVYNGIQRGTVLTFNAAKAAPYFTTITEVIKPITDRVATLYACYDDNTEEAIGIYQPGETVPCYRAYKVNEATADVTTDITTPVSAFVQARHVDLVADNDICPIGNFRAVKNAVLHIHWEDESDETRSDKHLKNAVEWANKELKQLRPPGEKGVIRVLANFTGATGLYAMR